MRADTTTCCRQCGQGMQSYVQPLADFQIAAGRIANTYVTCATEGCPLEGYTFAEQSYAAKDLTDYLKPRKRLPR